MRVNSKLTDLLRLIHTYWIALQALKTTAI